MRHLTVVLTAFSLAVTSNLPAQASRTAEGRQAILNYQLTLPRANNLIAAMDEMTRYVVSLPDFQERMVKSMKRSPEELRAQLEQDPKAIAIVKKHGLTAQDYLVGVPALRMALMAAQGLANNPNITASPANVAFAKAHLAELKPKLDVVDGIRPKP
jgi:Mg2+/Co2+ transporter CorB